MANDPRSHPLTEWDLRRLFNEGDFIKRIKRRELYGKNGSCNEVDPNDNKISDDIPLGSVAQKLKLYETATNRLVLIMHRYVKPDGKLGASKKNDPIQLIAGNYKFYRAHPNDPARPLSDQLVNIALGKTGLAAVLTYPKGIWHRLGPSRFWLKDYYRELTGRPRRRTRG
jgi:hypothetical protein